MRVRSLELRVGSGNELRVGSDNACAYGSSQEFAHVLNIYMIKLFIERHSDIWCTCTRQKKIIVRIAKASQIFM